MKGQVKLLLDQNRLTDDTVRQRAAAYHGLKDDKTRLETALKLTKAKNKDLSERNDELLGQVEFFRAREMGVIPPGSDSEDEDYEYASDDSECNFSDAKSEYQPRIQITTANQRPPIDTASQLMPDTQDLAPLVYTQQPLPTLAPESTAESLFPEESITHDAEIRKEVFESPWTPGLHFQDEAVSRP